MTPRRVRYSPEAADQLAALYDHIAAAASPEIAKRYVDAIDEKCASLAEFPHRGTPRPDLRDGLRTIPFRRRVTIAYAVTDAEVTILGLFYAGQDFDSSFAEE